MESQGGERLQEAEQSGLRWHELWGEGMGPLPLRGPRKDGGGGGAILQLHLLQLDQEAGPVVSFRQPGSTYPASAFQDLNFSATLKLSLKLGQARGKCEQVGRIPLPFESSNQSLTVS